MRLCALLAIFVAQLALGAVESVTALKKRGAKLTADVLNVDHLREAVVVCEKILAQQPDDLETLTRLARVCWSLGNHEPEKRDRKKWFARGRDVGKQIKELYPEKPEGYYWHGINYGEWVDLSSIFAKIGAKKVILDNMQKVLALNDKYDAGGAHIVIGRINYIAPGGSYAKAIECYERAIALAPRRTTAYAYLGELYLHEHVFDKAEKLLHQVQTMKFDPAYAIEARDDRKLVEKLLKKLDKKEDRYPEQESITAH